MRENPRKKEAGSGSGHRLKQRITGIFGTSSLLLSSCTTSTSRSLPNDMAQEPVFAPHGRRLRYRGNDLLFDPSLSFPSSYNHHSGPNMRLSVECGGCGATITSGTTNIPALVTKKDKVVMKNNEPRIREKGIFYDIGRGDGRNCPPASSSPPSKNYYKKKKRMVANGYDSSTSSSFGRSSEGDEEETGTLFSSKSFSSDTSEFYYYQPSSNASKKKKKKKEKKNIQPRRGAKKDVSHGFDPLVPNSAEEKTDKVLMVEEVDSGFAVVQRSSDPYGDFRSSMVEMIVGRQMFSSGDLEQLLRRYLSLNSPHHHPTIHEAFSDIWESLFG